jgi:ribose 5-phosphate isomerase B
LQNGIKILKKQTLETLKNMKNSFADGKKVMMRIGIATDFGWFELKRKLIEALNTVGYELAGIGDYELVAGENYPDFVVPLAKAVSDRNENQNRTDWANGIEACAEVNKISGVCAALIAESFDSYPEVENEDLYVRCLGGQVKGYAISGKKVMTFLNSDSPAILPSNQCLAKVRVLGTHKKMAERKKYLA